MPTDSITKTNKITIGNSHDYFLRLFFCWTYRLWISIILKIIINLSSLYQSVKLAQLRYSYSPQSTAASHSPEGTETGSGYPGETQSPRTTLPWETGSTTTHCKSRTEDFSPWLWGSWMTDVSGVPPTRNCQWLTTEVKTEGALPSSRRWLTITRVRWNPSTASRKRQGKPELPDYVSTVQQNGAQVNYAQTELYSSYLCGWTEIHMLSIPGKKNQNQTRGLENRAFTGNSKQSGIA